jgi:hypothetical protein
MMSDIALNMQRNQGTINCTTQLHLVGHFNKLYLDARNHEYQVVKVSRPEFYDHKRTYISYLCPTVFRNGNMSANFIKNSKYKFLRKSFSWESPCYMCGTTGGHDGAYSHFWHANAPRTEYVQRFYALKLGSR